MNVTLVPLDLVLPEPLQPRSVGVHVSSLIRCIATETGILRPEWAEDLSLRDVRTITDPTVILRMSLGLAWEEWYLRQLPHVVDHPGEMQVDGIYMTHDGESLDLVASERGPSHRILAVHEVKLTYKSTKTVGDLSSQWMWIAQMKAYCKGLGTMRANLHVLFVCGDYTYPIRPRLGPIEGVQTHWCVDFSQEEIDSNWGLLLEYKQHRLSQEEGV